jgi:hypothetical protein
MLAPMTRRAVAQEGLNSGRFEAQLASGANLEWYMEGGRSRTGKLRLQPGAEHLADGRRGFAGKMAAALAGVVAIGEFDYRLRHDARRLH